MCKESNKRWNKLLKLGVGLGIFELTKALVYQQTDTPKTLKVAKETIKDCGVNVL